MSQTVKLSDGRVLGYMETGDPNGRLVFHFHGLNSSRLEAKMVHQQMLERGVRLIGVDKPGIGLSTFQKKRKVLDFVDDIVALADSLNIKKFSVLGISSGGKYALACAYKIPHRLNSCNIISGATPMEFINEDMPKFNRFFISLIQKIPWIIEPLYWFLYGRLSQNPSRAEQFLGNILRVLDEVDKKLMEDKCTRQMLLEAFREAYIQGSRGVAYEASFDILELSWGFKLEDIEFAPIHFWHGALDRGIPLSMAKVMIEKIPNATLKVYPEDGHLSLVFNHIGEIVDVLVGD